MKCAGCNRNPESGDKSCPIKELFEERSKLADHNCGAWRPWSRKQLDRRDRAEVEQEALF